MISVLVNSDAPKTGLIFEKNLLSSGLAHEYFFLESLGGIHQTAGYNSNPHTEPISRVEEIDGCKTQQMSQHQYMSVETREAEMDSRQSELQGSLLPSESFYLPSNDAQSRPQSKDWRPHVLRSQSEPQMEEHTMPLDEVSSLPEYDNRGGSLFTTYSGPVLAYNDETNTWGSPYASFHSLPKTANLNMAPSEFAALSPVEHKVHLKAASHSPSISLQECPLGDSNMSIQSAEWTNQAMKDMSMLQESFNTNPMVNVDDTSPVSVGTCNSETPIAWTTLGSTQSSFDVPQTESNCNDDTSLWDRTHQAPYLNPQYTIPNTTSFHHAVKPTDDNDDATSLQQIEEAFQRYYTQPTVSLNPYRPDWFEYQAQAQPLFTRDYTHHQYLYPEASPPYANPMKHNFSTHARYTTEEVHSHFPQERYFFERPIIPCHSDTRNAFLIECKRRGLSYKDIKRIGGFKEAESTLRGRFRTLTKSKEQRVRKPQWQEKDILLLCEAVNISMDANNGDDLSHGFSSFYRHRIAMQPPKVSWKRVAEYIWTHGGSYHFGNATCKKKWCEVHGIQV